MSGKNEDFQKLLDEAVRFHGHLCGGQILGVRMAMAGLRELEIKDPRGREGRDLVIFVEIDRCATDAIIAVTGRTPGKRSIKIIDYGKMAATFVDIGSGRAVRVSIRGDSRKKVEQMAKTDFPREEGRQADLTALMAIAERDLLMIQEVRVNLRPQDLPGEPLDSVICQECGEAVLDMRHVLRKGRVLCKSCAQMGDYYTVRDTFFFNHASPAKAHRVRKRQPS